MDYHIIGFRECVAEVARYLVSIEGMDVQDPLRLRLMSHLQCFLTQRELSSKANASPAWSHSSSYQSAYAPHSSTYYHQNYAPQSASSSAPYIPQVATIPPHDQTAHQVPPHALHASAYATSATASAHDLYSSQHDASSGNPQSQQQQQSQSADQSNPTYTDISNLRGGYGNGAGYSVSTSSHGYSSTSNSYNNNSSKPYRPWGAEMAC